MRTRAFHPRDTRVVGTAIGLCTPHGFDATAIADAMADASARAPRGHAARVDDAALDPRLAALVSTADQRRMDRLTRFGALAGLACVRAAGLQVDHANRDRIGVIFTSTFGAVASTDEFMASAMPRLRAASPLLFPYTVQNACTGMVTLLLGVRGVNTTVSGINPVIYACDVLRTGRAEAVLAGGYDELTPRIAGAFGERGPAEGTGDAEPIGAVAEGAVAVMLETSDHAASRGATPLFEVLGTGSAVNLCTSGPATAENMRHVDADAIARAMRAALHDAGIAPDAIDLVVGLARDDNGQVASEDAALGTVFDVVPEVRRPKPALGDMLGASDVLAVAVGAALGADDARLVLVNGYQLGGHVSSVLLRFPGGR
jgi:3-oxoacyl-[acyl-carrier-protein] synthase II